MRLKGFIFTIDALAALALVIAGVYAFYAFQATPTPIFSTELHDLGRDFLTINLANYGSPILSTSAFNNLTGLSISNSQSAVPSNARLVGHAAYYRHPRPCSGTSIVPNSNACLSQSDVNASQYRFESWVWP